MSHRERAVWATGVFRIAVAAVLAALAGCAATPDPRASKSLKELVQPVELQLIVPQSGLDVRFDDDVDPSRRKRALKVGLPACATWVLTCLIYQGWKWSGDAEKVDKGMESIRPLQETIAGLSFDEQVTDQLSSALRSSGTLVSSATVSKILKDEQAESLLVDQAVGALMLVGASYSLIPDLSTFVLRLRVTAFARDDVARRRLGQGHVQTADPIRGPPLSLANALYWTDFRYEAPLPSPRGDLAQNAQRWREHDARLIRAAIVDGIAQASHAVAHDYGVRIWREAPELLRVRMRNNDEAGLVEQVGTHGRLLRVTDNLLVFEATLAEAGIAQQ
jgi:hypothetical protein